MHASPTSIYGFFKVKAKITTITPILITVDPTATAAALLL